MLNTVLSFKIDSSLLVAFLAGDIIARTQLPTLFHKKLIKAVYRIAPDLAMCGLAEDVVQEMWCLLIQKTPDSFKPEMGPAELYISWLLATAAINVRAQFTPPGQRTRLQRDDYGNVIQQQYPLSLDETIRTDDGTFSYEEVTADDSDFVTQTDSLLEAEWFISEATQTAPEVVYQALYLIYNYEMQILDAANIIGINRSTLRRKIDKWVMSNLTLSYN